MSNDLLDRLDDLTLRVARLEARESAPTPTATAPEPVAEPFSPPVLRPLDADLAEPWITVQRLARERLALGRGPEISRHALSRRMDVEADLAERWLERLSAAGRLRHVGPSVYTVAAFDDDDDDSALAPVTCDGCGESTVADICDACIEERRRLATIAPERAAVYRQWALAALEVARKVAGPGADLDMLRGAALRTLGLRGHQRGAPWVRMLAGDYIEGTLPEQGGTTEDPPPTAPAPESAVEGALADDRDWQVAIEGDTP